MLTPKSTDSKILHIVPLNDSSQHYEATSFATEENKWTPYPSSICLCIPIRKYVPETDGWILVHNSFDGREGLEWAAEILK